MSSLEQSSMDKKIDNNSNFNILTATVKLIKVPIDLDNLLFELLFTVFFRYFFMLKRTS